MLIEDYNRKSCLAIDRKKMSNTKMKGVLKGLRYISQIFDNEKEEEIQIGNPTDVKHVAHVGWDGPSVEDSPSWMRKYNSPPSFSSRPSDQNRDVENKENNPTASGSQDSSYNLRSLRPSRREVSEKSRRHSSMGSAESPTKAKSEKFKHRRPKSSSQQKDLLKLAKASRLPHDEIVSSSRNVPRVPNKSRQKKSTEGSFTKSETKTNQCEDELNELISCESPSLNQGLAS